MRGFKGVPHGRCPPQRMKIGWDTVAVAAGEVRSGVTGVKRPQGSLIPAPGEPPCRWRRCRSVSTYRRDLPARVPRRPYITWRGDDLFDVVPPRWCGLDVQKQSVTAHVLTPERASTRTFRTMLTDLEALVEAAQAAGRSRGTALAARYHPLAARRGKPRAAVAVGHRILVIAYHLLRDGGVYAARAGADARPRAAARTRHRAANHLRAHGYTVTPPPQPQLMAG